MGAAELASGHERRLAVDGVEQGRGGLELLRRPDDGQTHGALGSADPTRAYGHGLDPGERVERLDLRDDLAVHGPEGRLAATALVRLVEERRGRLQVDADVLLQADRGDEPGAPGDDRAENPFFKPANRKRVQEFLAKIRPIADSHGATLTQLAINWTIHRPGITTALVGARNAGQAEENARAAEFKLSEEETRRINELVKNLRLKI